MYERDYIERQIELAARVLARIMGMLQGGQPEQALAVFDEAYHPLLGVGTKLVATLTDAQLLTLLAAGGPPSPARWAVLVELLTREADAYADLGRPDESFPRYRKALRLLLRFPGGPGELPDQPGGEPAGPRPRRRVAPDAPPVQPGLARVGLPDPALVAELADRLRPQPLPPAARLQVGLLYEWVGRYADAEDACWEAVDADPGDAGTRAAVLGFYRRALAADDADLEAGNLPRPEVVAGLAQLETTPPAERATTQRAGGLGPPRPG